MRVYNTVRNRHAMNFLKKNYPFSLVLVSVIVESYQFERTNKFKADPEFDFDVIDKALCGATYSEIAQLKKVSFQKVQRVFDRFMTQFWAINGAALDVEFDRKQRLN